MGGEYNWVSGEPKSDVLSSTFVRRHWQSAGTKYRELIGVEAQVKRSVRKIRGDVFVPENKIEC